MKALAGLLGLIWAAGNLLAAYLLARNAFTAGTPAKEGFASQVLLFTGGLVLALFAAALAWACVKLLAGAPQPGEEAPPAPTSH
jgi:hypothetical protein